MKKFTLFFAALVTLALFMPEKASAENDYGLHWIDGVQYNLSYYENNDAYYAFVTAFSLEASGHVVVPETVEFTLENEETKTFTVTEVCSRVLKNRSISSIDLPSTIWAVTNNSFLETSALAHVIIRAETPPFVYDPSFKEELSNQELFDTPTVVKVYVPDGCVQAYKDDSNWSKRTHIFPISELDEPDDPNKYENAIYGEYTIDGNKYVLGCMKQSGYYASLSAFSKEASGHVVVPETVEYNISGIKTFRVTGVIFNVLSQRNITGLDLPSGIMDVKYNSFNGSELLEKVTIRAAVPPAVNDDDWKLLSDTPLFHSQITVKLYVPEGSVQAYKDDSNWSIRTEIYPISEKQALENVQRDVVPCTKVIKDGRLLIEKNGKLYNAQGAEIK